MTIKSGRNILQISHFLIYVFYRFDKAALGSGVPCLFVLCLLE